MKRLSPRAVSTLKVLHLLAVAAWVGGQMCLILLSAMRPTMADAADQYAIVLATEAIDEIIIVGGAIGTLVTGLIYSLFTNWGFFRHRWLAVKWVLTVSLILFGIFFLGPWAAEMADIALLRRAAAFTDPDFLAAERYSTIFGNIQFCLAIFLVIISVKKPWKHTRS